MVRTCTNFHRHSPSESMHRNTRIVQPGPQSFVSRPTTGPGGAFVCGWRVSWRREQVESDAPEIAIWRRFCGGGGARRWVGQSAEMSFAGQCCRLCGLASMTA